MIHTNRQRVIAMERLCNEYLSDLERGNGEHYAEHAIAVKRALEEIVTTPSLLVVALLHDIPHHPHGDRIVLALSLSMEERSMIARWHEHTKPAPVQSAATIDSLRLQKPADPRLILLSAAHQMADVRRLARLGGRMSHEQELWLRGEVAPCLRTLRLERWAIEVEDACFIAMQPCDAVILKEQYEELCKGAEKHLRSAKRVIERSIAVLGITCDVSARIKSLSSTYHKMQRKGLGFYDVYDLLGIRILAPSEEACYKVMDAIERSLTAVKGRSSDFIHEPKPSGYRSLHTVVIAPTSDRLLVEVQVRTDEMHWDSEYGTANHPGYKRECLATAARMAC